MHLREGEQILKIYHHHPTPFVFNILKLILAALPFFAVLFIFKESFSMKWYVIANLILVFGFASVVVYMSFIFWLDRLIVTNHRIVYVNWKLLSIREEAEAFHHEIEEIKTKEKGVFSYFKFLDYGNITIETAAAHVNINFPDAPDPEGIRKFIYHIRTIQ